MHTYVFDGVNKTITLDADESDYVNNTITTEVIDIYRAWKEWCVSGDGLKYPPAFRAIGNDPIGGGVYVGSYFFMQEGWRGVPPSRDNVVLILKGNLYTEVQGAMVLDPLPEYTTTLIMQNSSLTQTVQISSASALKDDERTKLLNVPTAVENADAVWEKQL